MAETFWRGKPNRAELEGYAADPRKLLARMDADGVARVGLINYVSPGSDGIHRGGESVDGAIRVGVDPSRLHRLRIGQSAFLEGRRRRTARVIEAGARALKVHPPHQLFRANAYQDALPRPRGSLSRRARRPGVPVTIHTGTSVFPGRAQPLRRSHGRGRRGDRFPGVDDPAGARRPSAVDGCGVLPRPPASERVSGSVRAFLRPSCSTTSPGSRKSRTRRVGHRLAEPRDKVDASECGRLPRVAAERRRQTRHSGRQRSGLWS